MSKERENYTLAVFSFYFGLFFVLSYTKGQTKTKLFLKNSQILPARILNSKASQVLVLATVHLKSYGDNFNHDALSELLDILETYNSEVIAIESAAPIFVYI